jgi:hypothetical protein
LIFPAAAEKASESLVRLTIPTRRKTMIAIKPQNPKILAFLSIAHRALVISAQEKLLAERISRGIPLDGRGAPGVSGVKGSPSEVRIA